MAIPPPCTSPANSETANRASTTSSPIHGQQPRTVYVAGSVKRWRDSERPSVVKHVFLRSRQSLEIHRPTGLNSCSDQQNRAICQQGYNFYARFTSFGSWDPFSNPFVTTTYNKEGEEGAFVTTGNPLEPFDFTNCYFTSACQGLQQSQAPAQPQNNVCTEKILSAVNNQFGTNFTPDNIQGNPFPNGGATNLNILGTGLPAAQFNSIQTGRYPLNWSSYVIGYGATLHITGQGLSIRHQRDSPIAMLVA